MIFNNWQAEESIYNGTKGQSTDAFHELVMRIYYYEMLNTSFEVMKTCLIVSGKDVIWNHNL